ncbi:nucleoside kinase [Ruegeria arenilitoris]|uniref:nucleoside kinase n=1 Tax=Ruegeria arenilitoris TaxID=1173585 RepID=UPI00147BE729|nr:nucleoside kinase [Ruegeria arenilitoris]
MGNDPLTIHIVGWPGSGKRTIGTALVEMIGGRLIDNHLMLNPASALFDRADPRHAALRRSLRHSVYEAALTLSPDVPIVFTDALEECPEDRALIAPTLDFVRQRSGRFQPFMLRLSEAENQRRLCDPERQGRGKLMDPGVLSAYRRDLTLLRLDGVIEIPVVNLSPNEAARAIVNALDDEVHRG